MELHLASKINNNLALKKCCKLYSQILYNVMKEAKKLIII